MSLMPFTKSSLYGLSFAKAKRSLPLPKTKKDAARRAERYSRLAGATSDPRLARIAALEAERHGAKASAKRAPAKSASGAKGKRSVMDETDAFAGKRPSRQTSTFRLDQSAVRSDGLTPAQANHLERLKTSGNRTKDQIKRDADQYRAENAKNFARARKETAAMMGRMESDKPWKSEWYKPEGGRSLMVGRGGVFDNEKPSRSKEWGAGVKYAETGNVKGFNAARAKAKPGSVERANLERGYAQARARIGIATTRRNIRKMINQIAHDRPCAR